MAKRPGYIADGSANLHLLRGGSIYTAEDFSRSVTSRYSAVFLISLDEGHLTILSNGKIFSGRVILIGPKVSRCIVSSSGLFAAIQVDPSHPEFNRFIAHRSLKEIDVLPSGTFDELSNPLIECHNGVFYKSHIHGIYNHIISNALNFIAPSKRADYRICEVINYLCDVDNFEYSFDYALRICSLTPGRLSHLFRNEIGISIRSFMAWKKINEAIKRFPMSNNITNVAHVSGFSDSSHLCRSFISSIGLAPSAFVSGRCVKVYDHGKASS